jgi:hypothetical protein
MKKAICFFAMVWSLGVLTALAQPISNEKLLWMDMVRDCQEDTVSFQYVQLSGEVTIQLGAGMQTAQIVIRMKNDSCIWATVRVMGIEGIRAMITRDSVWVMDRLKRTYTVQPLASFTKMLGVQVSVKALQQQFFGKLSEIPSLLSYQDASEKEMGLISFHGVFQPTSGNSLFANQKVELTRNEKKMWQSLAVEQDSSTFSLNYASYRIQAEGAFPGIIEARKSSQADPLFQLSYSKIEFKTSETFPFKIPESYLRRDER